METPKIFESEYRFCCILWEHEPVKSTELAKLCREKLGWSKATTYTVIKRLSERGVVKNEEATVRSLISKEQAQTPDPGRQGIPRGRILPRHRHPGAHRGPGQLPQRFRLHL